MDKASDRLESASDTLNGLATKISEAAEQFTVAAERTAVGLDGAARRLELVTDNLLAPEAASLMRRSRWSKLSPEQPRRPSKLLMRASRWFIGTKSLDSERGVVVAAAESIRAIKLSKRRAASYDGQLEKAFKTFSTELGRSVSEVENHANAVHQQYADALGTLQAVIENAKAFSPKARGPRNEGRGWDAPSGRRGRVRLHLDGRYDDQLPLVIMILLAFFATQFTDPETVPRSQYDEILKQKTRWKKSCVRYRRLIGTSDLQVSDDVQAMKEEIDDLRRRLAMPGAPNQMEVYNK